MTTTDYRLSNALETLLWAFDVPENEMPRISRSEAVKVIRAALGADWDAKVSRAASEGEKS